jgi:hypothetical protein
MVIFDPPNASANAGPSAINGDQQRKIYSRIYRPSVRKRTDAIPMAS